MPELSEPVPPAGRDDWMMVTVQAPPEVGGAVLDFLEQRFGYRHVPDGIDWCVWERPEDWSQATFAPCEPITTNVYVVDWRKGQGRGDVPVRIEGRL